MSEKMPAKTHIDFAYELDLVVKHDARAPLLDREFGHYTGAGVPLFSIGGGYYRYGLIEILARFHARKGYYIVETPIIASASLYELSGHLHFYKKNMFLFKIEDHDFAIKPMNCPYHILVFMHEVARNRGKVKLPFKIFEAGRVHRYEPSGSLYGLLRVRGFTQDDAHIITPREHAVESIYSVFLEMRELMEKLFGLEVSKDTVYLRLSLSDPKLIGTEFMGTAEEWEAAEGFLEAAADRIKDEYGIPSYKERGEAAFYGPKIDIIMRLREQGIEKEWQLGTIQFDFNLPRRFRLYELVKDVYGYDEVYIIHRALMGSLERFLGVYLDYYKGRLPFTLAPVQFAIIAIQTGEEPVDEKIGSVAVTLKEELLKAGFRAGLLFTSKTGLSKEVRRIESTSKPAILVYIGKKEVEEGFLTVRPYSLRERKRRNIRVPLEPDSVSGLSSIAEELERGVVEIAGYAPRIPADMSYIL